MNYLLTSFGYFYRHQGGSVFAGACQCIYLFVHTQKVMDGFDDAFRRAGNWTKERSWKFLRGFFTIDRGGPGPQFGKPHIYMLQHSDEIILKCCIQRFNYLSVDIFPGAIRITSTSCDF